MEGTEVNLTLIFINKQQALVFCSSGQGQEMGHLPSGCPLAGLHQYLTVPCDASGISSGNMTGKFQSVHSQKESIFRVGKNWSLLRLMQ